MERKTDLRRVLALLMALALTLSLVTGTPVAAVAPDAVATSAQTLLSITAADMDAWVTANPPRPDFNRGHSQSIHADIPGLTINGNDVFTVTVVGSELVVTRDRVTADWDGINIVGTDIVHSFTGDGTWNDAESRIRINNTTGASITITSVNADGAYILNAGIIDTLPDVPARFSTVEWNSPILPGLETEGNDGVFSSVIVGDDSELIFTRGSDGANYHGVNIRVTGLAAGDIIALEMTGGELRFGDVLAVAAAEGYVVPVGFGDPRIWMPVGVGNELVIRSVVVTRADGGETLVGDVIAPTLSFTSFAALHLTSGAAVDALLADVDTVAISTDGTTNSVPVVWATVGTFNPTGGATNTFRWTAVLGAVNAGGFTYSGTVEIDNPILGLELYSLVTTPSATIFVTTGPVLTEDGIRGYLESLYPNVTATTTPGAVTATIPIGWTLVGGFNPAYSEQNTFEWSMQLPTGLSPGMVTTTGTALVHNPSAQSGTLDEAVADITAFLQTRVNAVPWEDINDDFLTGLSNAAGGHPIDFGELTQRLGSDININWASGAISLENLYAEIQGYLSVGTPSRDVPVPSGVRICLNGFLEGGHGYGYADGWADVVASGTVDDMSVLAVWMVITGEMSRDELAVWREFNHNNLIP